MFKKKHLIMFLLLTGLFLNCIGKSSNYVVSAAGNYITKTTITDGLGKPLTEAHQYSDIQMNFEFALPNNVVKEGDVTSIQLPKELRFLRDQVFDIKNATGDIIAKAKITESTKTIELKYTKFVENHSDVTGSFYFTVRLDTKNITDYVKTPIVITIDGEPKFITEMEFQNAKDNPYEKFTKYGWFSNESGTEIRYTIRVNGSKESYKNVVIEDNLESEGISYDVSSFRVLKGTWKIQDNGHFHLENSEDITNSVSINFINNNRGFTVNLGDINGEGYRIDYKVKTKHGPINGELFKNKARMLSEKTVVRDRVVDIVYQTAGGTADGYNYSIHINKVNENGEKLAGAEFDVIRDSVGVVVGKITTDDSGKGTISGLLKDNYTIKEVKAPQGYQLSTDVINISPADFNSSKEVFKDFVNKKIELVSVRGQKTWNDMDDQDGKRPKSISVNLLANGKVVETKEVSEADGWQYVFENLPKYENGQEIVYTITEDQIPEYNTEIKGYDITNSYTPGKTSVSVTKAWNDSNNQDGLRPSSIQVQLYANDEAKGTPVELNAGNQWTYTWNDLPEKAKGKAIVYTVKEISSVPGYTAVVDDSNLGNVKITNSHTPEVINIKGQKTWNDMDDQDGIRPKSISVNLLADGKVIETKKVSEADGWKYAFENLPKYENGKEIVYTVTEDQIPEYITEINGYDITNSYIPRKTNINVMKFWDDINNQDGIRPKSIQVQLYADGNAKGDPVELNEGNQWRYTWNDLPEKAKGKTITYTVNEISEVQGYATTVDESESGTVKITNSHTPDVTNIKGQKTWNDMDDQDGKRPKSIKVNLLANGKVIETREVSEADGWSYEFTNLPKYQKGQEIIYTVTENQVLEYSAEIRGYDIFNNYTPGKTSISVTKEWIDNNNQDGIRPKSIKVQLYANGRETRDIIELSAENMWTYTWTDLPIKAKGVDIKYSIEEVVVESGYQSLVNASDLGNVRISNIHVPEVIKIEGEKIWDDNNNQDGIRPEKIKVNLVVGNKVIKTQEVSEANNWKYIFEDLPKYENGQEIEYSITEDAIEGYTTKVNGFNITNHHAPETISLKGIKTWVDNNDEKGIRPDKIKITLYANGKEVSSTEVTKDNNWTYEFTNLPKYSKGVEISYSIQEDKVDKYKTTIDGFNIINTLEPETLPKTGIGNSKIASTLISVGSAILIIALLRKSQRKAVK